MVRQKTREIIISNVIFVFSETFSPRKRAGPQPCDDERFWAGEIYATDIPAGRARYVVYGLALVRLVTK
jgi:hypothetical protein